MTILIEEVTFRHPNKDDFQLIYDWFKKPHVSEFFDDPDSGRSIPDLLNYLSDKDYFYTPWLACYHKQAFAYFMTALVRKNETGIWSKWRDKKGKTYSMDMLIGEEAFLGKNMSHLVISKLIHDKFKHATSFLIDPELRNIHAIHVYEKAGFVIIDEFKGEHGQFAGIPHLIMKLALKP